MTARIYDSVLDLIGQTPLIRLSRISPASHASVLGKMESLNPGGSVKDRIGLNMILDAERRSRSARGGACGSVYRAPNELTSTPRKSPV